MIQWLYIHPFVLVDDGTVGIDIDSEQSNVEPHQQPQRHYKPILCLIEEMP